MATTLNNTAIINGQYDGEDFSPQQASAEVAIVDVAVTKSASPLVWVGNDPLTYTVAVVNNDADLPLTDLVLTDTLDPLIAYVEGSAAIDGVPIAPEDVTYDEATGLLTIQVSQIPANSTGNITFRVTKK